MKDTLKYTQSYETEKSLQHYSEAIFNVGMLKAEQTLLKKYFGNNLDIKIADLGCGPGRFSLNALLLGYLNIDGYDISKASIKLAKYIQAKEMFQKPNTQLNFYQADLTKNNSLKENHYHVAFFTFNSLMCIPGHQNKIKALKNAWNSLLKGGILIFTADEVDNDIKKQQHIQQAAERLVKSNITNWRAEDVIYQIENKEGVLCFYNKEDILKLLQESSLPKPIFIAKRDEIAQETLQGQKFSDNAYYYVLRK
ncbi:class I SAM-dependent methyltransferase [Mycoplasmopsis citelli]|uniref:class I SAM-dependent methyltransferase n=1 Tax=Mycoplasmopsis citelli TaxID=171281 RepID=UPI002113D33D|nr:class I SAM-dependent methyltransferase [Mycoplasmopsis citelli]UUD36467.1 class I SAM-dependent methyltransferase [Mycoplasmopsis citelli]